MCILRVNKQQRTIVMQWRLQYVTRPLPIAVKCQLRLNSNIQHGAIVKHCTLQMA
jgi:hypothetical protein